LTVCPVRLARSRTQPFQGCSTGSNPVRDVLHLKKRFGQHFLTDRSILRRIVQFAGIHPEDTVVEIGPGAGALTIELAAAARQVIAIEIDRDLVLSLRPSVPPNVEIIEGDALDVQWPVGTFHMVGNLPYNISTPLLKRFITQRDQIRDVTVMVQKEVAERLRARPSTRDYGPLSVLIQYYATVKYGFTVSPGAFTPRPKVDSAVVRLDWKSGVPGSRDFTDFVHDAFASRRKKLVNNLLMMFGSLGRNEVLRRVDKASIPRDVRPEELSVDEFLRLYNEFRDAEL
jgi:16S rRNA (adenine1518-N6/adenine1519-N6)-dimethyltransferase